MCIRDSPKLFQSADTQACPCARAKSATALVWALSRAHVQTAPWYSHGHVGARTGANGQAGDGVGGLSWQPSPAQATDQHWAADQRLGTSGLGYLNDHTFSYKPSLSLSSSEEVFLPVPLPLQARLIGTQERAFSVAASKLWNGLPQEVRLASIPLSFC